MATFTLCDFCRSTCSAPIQLFGWWGKVFDKGFTPKQDGWKPVLRDDCDRIEADVCQDCLHDRFGIASLHAEPTREQQIAKRREAFPNEAGIKTLRMCAGYTIDEIYCDRCQSPCFEKHLRFMIDRKSRYDSPRTAELCESCAHATGATEKKAELLFNQL